MNKILIATVAIVAAATIFSAPVREDISARLGLDTDSEIGIVEVAYLESTGTQYFLFAEAINGIDCFILPQANATTAMGQSVGRSNGGSRSDSISFATLHAYGLTIDTGDYQGVHTYDMSRDHLFHVVVHGTAVDVDDIAYTMGAAWARFTSFRNAPFALFGSYRTDTSSVQTQSCRIGRCALYIGDTLLYDLVPVRFEGVGYMLDTLTGELLENQGTGDFLLGPDIAPLEF